MTLPDLLAAVSSELQREPGVLAVFLTGSVARGDHDAFSDLDLSVLVESEAFVRNDTSYRQGRLLSVERSTPQHRARALSDPETALWNLHSLRWGQPLHDPCGVFADLQTRARALDWVTLAPQADRRAGAHIAGVAEELHKVMGGLQAGDQPKVAYALLGLTLGLGTAALLSTGTLIPSENRYLTLAQRAWNDAGWRAAYGSVAALSPAGLPERGRAALRAYLRAVALTRWSAGPDSEVAHEAARRAQAALADPTPG